MGRPSHNAPLAGAPNEARAKTRGELSALAGGRPLSGPRGPRDASLRPGPSYEVSAWKGRGWGAERCGSSWTEDVTKCLFALEVVKLGAPPTAVDLGAFGNLLGQGLVQRLEWSRSSGGREWPQQVPAEGAVPHSDPTASGPRPGAPSPSAIFGRCRRHRFHLSPLLLAPALAYREMGLTVTCLVGKRKR